MHVISVAIDASHGVLTGDLALVDALYCSET
jgi:hypothetical protein